MSRTKTVIKNAVWELSYYLIVIILGFLAPRYIILIYGSEANGLFSTITQILNIILLLQAGATTAAIFSLYKPIANNAFTEISKNIYFAEKFFRKISYIFCVVMLVAATVTAIFIHSEINSKLIFIAFIIMGLKSFLDLYFTSKFRIVFTAFQEKFIVSIATLIEQVVYYSLVFLTLYLRIHFIFIYIWLFVGCVVKVFYLKYKYKKKYGEILPKYEGKEPGKIPGRGYALANEVSHSVVSSSTAVVLSFMYGLQETSVYSVYALVSQALTLIVTALSSTFAPSFGNLVATNNKENARRVFGIFQYVYVMLNSIIFYCMIVLIAPFAKIYTSGATDINYVNTVLASIMGLSGIFSAYRIPYNIIVSSCGFFKETWKQPVICIGISLTISVVGGKFNYSLIMLGPAVFYLINFIYQHFKLKKLAPYLLSAKTFLMFGVSITGFVASTIVCACGYMPEKIVSWLFTALVSLVASIIFIILASLLLLPNEAKTAANYMRNHFFRGNLNA